jgi:RNA polymerase-binding transcription factor DksA
MPTKNKPSPKPKKPAAKAAPKQKPAPKKPAAAKKASAVKKPAPAEKTVPAKKVAPKPAAAAKAVKVAPKPAVPLTGFLAKQRQRLLNLKDTLLDSMNGVAKDSLRSRAEGSEASAFGMHQADAGSDAYDRDFALSLLSQEQDAFYEIQEAIKRIEAGTYGVCEMSNKTILKARLEAIPWARFTVECQAQVEKEGKAYRNSRQPVTSLFGLTDDDGRDRDEEEPSSEFKE